MVSDWIRRRKPIDKGVDRRPEAHDSVGTHVRLIDGNEEEPSAGRILVAGVALGGRLWCWTGLRPGERHPFGADDGTRLAVDGDAEIARLQIANRLTVARHDRDVDRRDFNAGSKYRRLRLLTVSACDRCGDEYGPQDAAHTAPSHRPP